jgi:hypothetical protein
VASEFRRSSSARRPRLARLARGGPDGNSRLTATTAAVLLVLLAAEGATVPFVREQLTLHIFLGLVLIPPVLLKLASTGWRFARYYRGAVEYVTKGPPHAFMRFLVAPIVVASTMGLFGTGALLVVMHPARGAVLDLHKASFLVWFGAMSAHVLGHVLNVPRLARADLARSQPGARVRQFIVAGAIVAGLIVAIAALPAAHDWVHWVASHHRDRHDG